MARFPDFGIDLADAGDLAVFDRHVAVKPRVARAVDHPAAMNYDIEFRHAGLPIMLVFCSYITAFSAQQGGARKHLRKTARRCL